jgi:hypothetical protein
MLLTILRRRSAGRAPGGTSRTAVRTRLITGAGVLATITLISACGTHEQVRSPNSNPSSNPPAAAGGGQTSTGPLAFARCMRAHGVANFPDPDAQGHLFLPQGGFDPNSTQFQAARQACQSLMPNAGSDQVLSPQNLDGLAKFAKCMTEHGLPMSADGNGSISFPNGMDFQSQQFQAAYKACIKLVPAGLPFGGGS